MKITWSPTAVLVVVVLFVSLLLSHLASARVARVRYDGFQVWRAKPNTQEQADAIYSLQQYGVELWRDPVFGLPEGPTADLFINPAAIPAISATLSDAEVDYEVIVPDIQPLIDVETQQIEETAGLRLHQFSFTGWQIWETIVDYMREMAEDSKGRIQLVQLDEKSVEKNPIYVLKIRSEDSKNEPETKPVIFIEGGMHAREWISPAVALYIATRLANNIDGKDGEVNRKLLDRFDVHILPIANPDGYKYTQVNRMWRKSRSPGPTLLNWCSGVDLNRNFDVKWNGTFGGSTFSCAQDYKGPAAFSEPETRALGKYWRDLGDRFKVFFSLHSYGQIWAYPYGYKRDDPKDHFILSEVVTHGTEKLREKYGARYSMGSAAQLLYTVTGSSMDYVYEVLNVKHSYLLELRPDLANGQGFLLNPELILPTSIETWDGIQEALDYVHKDLYGYKYSAGLDPSVAPGKPKDPDAEFKAAADNVAEGQEKPIGDHVLQDVDADKDKEAGEEDGKHNIGAKKESEDVIRATDRVEPLANFKTKGDQQQALKSSEPDERAQVAVIETIEPSVKVEVPAEGSQDSSHVSTIENDSTDKKVGLEDKIASSADEKTEAGNKESDAGEDPKEEGSEPNRKDVEPRHTVQATEQRSKVEDPKKTDEQEKPVVSQHEFEDDASKEYHLQIPAIMLLRKLDIASEEAKESVQATLTETVSEPRSETAFDSKSQEVEAKIPGENEAEIKKEDLESAKPAADAHQEQSGENLEKFLLKFRHKNLL